MQAATTTTRKEKQPIVLDEKAKKQGLVLDVVLTIDPKLWEFSGQYVGALTGFYAIKAKCTSWSKDRKWLEQDWRKVDSIVDLFAVETATAGLPRDAVPERHQGLANEIISKFTSSRLRTEFVTLSNKVLISFDNIVGGICRGWLNDSPVDFCLETLARSVGKCHVLSSLTWAIGWPSLPKTALAATNFIIHPVNLHADHWGLIILRLHYTAKTSKLRVHVYMYEPLIDDDYHHEMEIVWTGIPKDKENEGKEGLRGYV
ncbi:hypothetical protein PHYSODRAFT_418207, partial [Phytophthora sojae]